MQDATLFAYADRLSARPGERLDIMVSSTAPEVRLDVVRLLCGDEHPDGPGARSEPVEVAGAGTYPASVQPIARGSFAVAGPVALGAAFTAELWAWATAPDLGRRQALMARPGHFALVLDEDGALVLEIGGVAGPSIPGGLARRRWTRVVAAFDGDVARLEVESSAWPPARAEASAAVPAPVPDPGARVLLAAAALDPAFAHPAGVDLFNGKLEAPRLWDGAGTPVGAWTLGAGADVELVGLPDAPATGRLYDGSANHPAIAPAHYGAALFHDDDLDDCHWDVTAVLELPADLPSGVYGARLAADGAEDVVPFFVLPPAGSAGADVAILFPTVSYGAYANERMQERPFVHEPGVMGRAIVPDRGDDLLRAHPELGNSLYDTHPDGSGVAYSSFRRPVLNMRPWHRNWQTQAPRAFSADLYVVDWLDRSGVAADALTDHDLHAEGASLLAPYRVLVTGCHPEYWTAAMLDALTAWLSAGGRLMYLGGNGFYWVTSIDPARPHLVEIRRGVCGIRCWESEAGEMHHTSTGELGGLWRNRGRSPNALVGIGFAAQGFDDAAPGYHQLPGASDPRAAFVTEGIAPDEEIGAFGHSMGGAASDEIDRHDVRYGSPPEAIVVATSQGGHSDYVLLVCEDVPVTHLRLGGTTCDDVRADITLMPTAEGGAVFSVGSIGWTAAMAWNDYDNNVARMSANVLRRFRDPAPLDLARAPMEEAA
jgi:N,N-dimethylformamidase